MQRLTRARAIHTFLSFFLYSILTVSPHSSVTVLSEVGGVTRRNGAALSSESSS